MTPTQRTAALRLADELQRFDGPERESLRDEAAALLRELAVEPEPDPFVGTMADQLLQVIAGIWTEHPDYSLRQTLNALNALMLPAEPVNPAPGYCKHCKQYTIEEPLPAEPVPVPVPVAWWCKHPHGGGFMTCDELAAQHYMHKFRRAGENGPTLVPLYTAPQQRKPTIELHEVRAIAGWFETLPDGSHDSQEEARFKAGQRYAASHIRAACECSVYGIKETP